MDNISISAQLAMTMMAHDDERVKRIFSESIGALTKKYLDSSCGYCMEDLPLVAAALKIAANSLMAIMPEAGRKFADKIAGSTETIVVDVGGLMRQREEGDAGEEKV